MKEEWYLALLGYIRQEYFAGLTNSPKKIMRRASNNYQVVGDQLYYIDLNVDGSIFKRLVLHGRKEETKFFWKFHLTVGGHRESDATIGKIKARYYWQNYYKDIEEKFVDKLGSY